MSRIEKAFEKAVQLRRTDMSQKPQDVGAPVFSVGQEPVTFNPANPAIVAFRNPDSPVAEEYRKLKAKVLRHTRQEFQNVLAVTSSVSGEGKSITCINLAVMLAQEYSHTVLLVDADLRKPSLQAYLGVKPEFGLSECLNEGIELGRAIVKTGLPKLTFLSAGKSVSNPAELLTSYRMKEFLSELKQRYRDRYILIDTPPVLLFAEAQALSLFVDGVILVVKEGVASVKGIGDTIESLKGANILGMVYNDSSAVSSTSGYYGYYGRYSYRRQEESPPVVSGRE